MVRRARLSRDYAVMRRGLPAQVLHIPRDALTRWEAANACCHQPAAGKTANGVPFDGLQTSACDLDGFVRCVCQALASHYAPAWKQSPQALFAQFYAAFLQGDLVDGNANPVYPALVEAASHAKPSPSTSVPSLVDTFFETCRGGLYLFRPVHDECQLPPLHVLWDSPAAMVVNKPAGLATMPRGAFVARSIVVAARRQFQNDAIVAAHRLDRLTSGCLLLVKDPAFRGRFQGMFQRGAVHKTYLALTHQGGVRATRANTDASAVCHAGGAGVGGGVLGSDASAVCHAGAAQVKPGSFASDICADGSAFWGFEPAVTPVGDLRVGMAFEWCLPMSKARDKLGVSVADGPSIAGFADGVQWKRTVTCGSIASLPPGRIVWHMQPVTGFMHQIRVALAWAGVPIVGDPLYPSGDRESLARANSIFLHAKTLQFTDPQTGKAVHVEAPCPW